MALVELIQFVVPAGESEKYLLSDDSEDEEDKRLDTVEEGQEEPVPLKLSESNTDAEGGDAPEEVKDGGGDSIPEEASSPSADTPESPAPEEAEVTPPSESEPAVESSADQQDASEPLPPPPEVEAAPIIEEAQEEQLAEAEATPVGEVKEEVPVEEPASDLPTPGKSLESCGSGDLWYFTIDVASLIDSSNRIE